MSTRLFLVRHGESVWNAAGRLQGQADPPLSARGLQQAYALAEAFSARPLAAIYCSPLARAHTTASYIAAPHGLCPRVAAAFQEVHLGRWQGDHPAAWSDHPAAWSDDMRARYAAWHTAPALVTPPGGEALDDVRARVASALDALVAAHPDASVVVVTHSIAGRVALCHLLDIGLELIPRLKLKQASITLVRRDVGGAVLERLGDTSHLDAPPPAVWGVTDDRLGEGA